MGYAQSKVKYLIYGDDKINSSPVIETTVSEILQKNRHERSLSRLGDFIKLDLRNENEKNKYLDMIKEDLERNISIKEFEFRYKPIYHKLCELGKTSYEIFKSNLVMERNNRIIDNMLSSKKIGKNMDEKSNDNNEFHDIMQISVEEL